MRQHIASAPTLLAVAYGGMPALVRAQDTSWLDTLAREILAVITVAVPVFAGIALAVFLWGLVVFMANAGNDQSRTAGKRHMVWGIVGLTALVAVWGIVLVVQELFGLGGGAVPPLPGFRG